MTPTTPPERRAAPRRATLAILLAGLPLACGDGSTPADPLAAVDERANVLFVLIDTLRADHTSLHGHRNGRDTTPFLDELGDSSFVFDRAYAAASWTRPSMASIFSARLPGGHGCETRDGVLVDEITTWPEVLQADGYETRAVMTNGNIHAKMGFDQGFDEYRHEKDHPRSAYADARQLRQPIVETFDKLGGDRPWVFYVHYVDPHDPYEQHDDTDFSPEYAGDFDGSRDVVDQWNFKTPPPADKQRIIDLYDGDILWHDHQLRMLFERLEARGVLDSTWIVVTSDHGEGLWDHDARGHGAEVFEHQIHVPLLVRPPGGLDQARRFDDPISLIDVGPTLLDLLGSRVPAEFEGRSWADALRGTGAAPVRPVVVDELLNGDGEDVDLAAIIDGHHKLILDRRPSQRAAWLFDLDDNPTERWEHVVDARVERNATAARLERTLMETLADSAAGRPSGTLGLDLGDSDLAEQLAELGYAGEAEDTAPAPGDSEPGEGH